MSFRMRRRLVFGAGALLAYPAVADFYRNKDNGGFFWGQRSGVEVRRSPDGLFYVAGSINGVDTRFMVDTGASHVALSVELARAAGIVGERDVRIATASHNVSGRMGTAKEIDVGGLMARNVTVLVSKFPPGAPPALLGQSFLTHFTVSAERHVMWIE